jgi:hypothetical protein
MSIKAEFALLLLLPLAAWAGGMVTSCTEAALRAAVTGGGTVTFACDGTILLANTITNDSGSTLDGSGRLITITASPGVRVFCVNTNVSFTVVNLTIADANSLGGSAILNLDGSVSLTGVLLRSNTATIYGTMNPEVPQASGGALFNRGGTMNATNCSFVGNTAQSPSVQSGWAHEQVYGGAIRNESGLVNLQSSVFVGNRASGASSAFLGSDSTLTGDPGLRHAYATHCMARGANVRAIQEVMGHKQLETTMGHLHPEALSVRSPLDTPGAADQAVAKNLILPAGTEADLYGYAGLEVIPPANRELPWLQKHIDSGL